LEEGKESVQADRLTQAKNTSLLGTCKRTILPWRREIGFFRGDRGAI